MMPSSFFLYAWRLHSSISAFQLFFLARISTASISTIGITGSMLLDDLW
jgi:hypothetical protein